MSWKIRTTSEDTENVDPATLKRSMKRKRGSDEDEPSLKASPKTYRLPALPPKNNNVREPPSTPTKSKRFLKPAGRSPRAKSCKAFGRRSPISKGRPELRARRSVIRPFSVAAALTNGKPKAKSTTTAPGSWFFEIHVDSEQDEMTNLVQHSTCVLDISDDEGKRKRESRGKENIPPQELGIDIPSARQQVSAAACKEDMLEDRSPLGELNAADYYGAGCNAFSCAIVYDDDSENIPEQKKAAAPAPRRSVSKSTLNTEKQISTSVASLLETTASAVAAAKTAKPTTAPSDTEIKIWESGSAVDEAAKATETDPETSSSLFPA